MSNESVRNSFGGVSKAVDEVPAPSRAREIRTQSISDILPTAPSVPRIWTNLPEQPNAGKERESRREIRSDQNLNLNGISNGESDSKILGGNGAKDTLSSPTARHPLANLSKVQGNSKPLLSPTAQHLLSRRFF